MIVMKMSLLSIIIILNLVLYGSIMRIDNLILEVDRNVYVIGEEVKIIFRNISNETIFLSNSAPWRIVDEYGNLVFSPIALQVLTPIKPGSFKVWIWNQKDNFGNQIKPGSYRVIFRAGNYEFSVGFKIVKSRADEYSMISILSLLFVLIMISIIGLVRILRVR